MQTLTQKQRNKLQLYAHNINEHLKAEKEKNMYRFFVHNLTFVKDFHLHYETHTDTLAQATSLDDILLSGLHDLFHIVKEEGFGLKEYKEVDEKDVNSLTQCRDMFAEEFPLFIEMEVSENIEKAYQKAKKDADSSAFVQALETQRNTIQQLRKIAHTRHKINRYLTKLEWLFIKINLAVTLIQLKNIDAYDKLKKLEKKVQKTSKKILKTAKRYDEAIEQLPYIQGEMYAH